MKAKKRKRQKKLVSLIVAAVLLAGGLIGGTLAWLIDKDEVTNTFTVGNIDITLTESDSGQDSDGNLNTNSYKMIPGQAIIKDPVVTVEADSEDCWLFVKLEKSTNYDDFLTHAIAAGWTELSGTNDVFYREVTASTENQDFAVLSGNKVIVKSEVTKAMMDGLENAESLPTLTISAYAVQKTGFDTASAAWAEANK